VTTNQSYLLHCMRDGDALLYAGENPESVNSRRAAQVIDAVFGLGMSLHVDK